MKAIFTTFFLCLSCWALNAQTTLFNKTYNLTNEWEFMSGLVEEDSSYFFINRNIGYTYEANRLLFGEINKEGELLWSKDLICVDSSLCTTGRPGLIKEDTGNFLTYGEYRVHPDSLADAFIYRFDQNGDSISFYRIGGEGTQGFLDMKKHPEGGYIACGGNMALDPAGDIYIVRLNENLEVIWEQVILQEGFQVAYKIDFTEEGGYFIVGKGAVYLGAAQIIALKLDNIGNLEWYNILGGEGNNDGRHNGKVLSDGNFLVAASKRNTSDTDFDSYLIKLNIEGTIIWEKVYNAGTRTLFNTNIIELEDGSIVVGGSKTVFGVRYSRIAKFTDEGELIWEQRYHGRLPTDSYFYNIFKTQDGFLAMGNAYSSDESTLKDGWIVKMDSEGQSCDDNPDCLLVNIAEVEASGKAQLTVSPNPANNQALLYYYLPKVLSNCSIEVYDLNGRLVFSESHQQASQEYGTQLDVSAWPSGMYVVQLRSEEGVLLASSLLVRG